jgi:Tfp pilus tip-associated adhesin PilY1
VLSDNSVPYVIDNSGQQRDGWFINFTGGERIITTPAVRSGIVFFNTVIPNTAGSCAFGGTGWLMAADVINGGEPDEVIFDVQNDDQLTEEDKLNNHVVSGIQYDSGVPAQSSFLSDLMFTATSSGEVERRKVIDVDVRRGRISWREIELN